MLGLLILSQLRSITMEHIQSFIPNGEGLKTPRHSWIDDCRIGIKPR